MNSVMKIPKPLSAHQILNQLIFIQVVNMWLQVIVMKLLMHLSVILILVKVEGFKAP